MYMLHLGPAIHSSECKSQYKIRDYFDISGQPGRKRFVLDRSEPIKVVCWLCPSFYTPKEDPSRSRQRKLLTLHRFYTLADRHFTLSLNWRIGAYYVLTTLIRSSSPLINVTQHNVYDNLQPHSTHSLIILCHTNLRSLGDLMRRFSLSHHCIVKSFSAEFKNATWKSQACLNMYVLSENEDWGLPSAGTGQVRVRMYMSTINQKFPWHACGDENDPNKGVISYIDYKCVHQNFLDTASRNYIWILLLLFGSVWWEKRERRLNNNNNRRSSAKRFLDQKEKKVRWKDEDHLLWSWRPGVSDG